MSNEKAGFWKFDGIAETQRQRIEKATEGWTAEQLREKLIEVVTGAYPVNYVLSHIVNNPERPHGGMNISSDLFPYHFEDSKPPEGWEGPYGCTYTESKQCESLPLDWSKPQPEAYYERHECDFDPGVTPHPSYRILSVYQYATAASINCGAFGTEEVRRMNKALTF